MENNALLNSMLAGIGEFEGILVCRDTLPAWDESAIQRGFATFQFTPSPADDAGLNFYHPESGTTLCYYGNSVSIGVGGHTVDAMDDLLRVLSALGWVHVDVYSRYVEAFYADLSRQMPATVEMDLVSRDVPQDMGELSNFAAQAHQAVGQQQKTAIPQTLEDEFMDMFRKEEGIPASASAPPHSAFVPASANFNDDAFSSEPMVPQAIVAQKIIALNTPSPVGASLPIVQAVVNPVDADFVIPEPISMVPVPVSMPSMGVGVSTLARVPEVATAPVAVAPRVMPAETAVVNIPSPVVHVPAPVAAPAPVPVVRVAEIATIKEVAVAAPVVVVPKKQPDVFRLGKSIVVLDAPESPLRRLDIAALAASGVASPREVVLFEPGATALTDQHVGWDLFGEIPDGPEGLEAARLLVASLWPSRPHLHLLLTALVLMIREDVRAAGGVGQADLAALFGVNGSVASHLQRLEVLGTTQPVFGKLAAALRQQLGCAPMDAALQESVQDLWSVLLLPLAAQMDASPESVRPAISFRALVHSAEARVIVLTLDALDAGGAAEFFVQGILRFVPLLVDSRRIKVRAKPVEPVQEPVDTVDPVADLSPEELRLLSKMLLRLKGEGVLAA